MLLVFGAVTVTVRTNDPPALLANAILSSLLQMFYRWLCRRSVGWFQAAPGRHGWFDIDIDNATAVISGFCVESTTKNCSRQTRAVKAAVRSTSATQLRK